MQLEPYAGHPDGAPWVCNQCHRGFWVAQLSHEAKAMYRPKFHDHGHSKEAQKLRDKILLEREAARARGTSTLEEHIGQLTKDHLAQVARWNLSDEFRPLVEGAM